MVISKSSRCFVAVMLLLMQESLAAGSEPASCECAFDGNDPADCLVLGQFPSRGHEMIWELASPECMEYYKVHSPQTVDPAFFTEIWPDGPDKPGNVDLLVAWLQHDETGDYSDHLSRNIKLLELSYFFQSLYPSPKSPVVLKDRLMKGSQHYDCTLDPEACWGLVREFLMDITISEDGEHEEVMGGIADYLWGRMEHDKLSGQELVRSQICLDENAIQAQAATQVCSSALINHIHDLKKTHEIQDCNVFGLGPDQFSPASVSKCNSVVYDDSAAFSASAARLALSFLAGALTMIFW